MNRKFKIVDYHNVFEDEIVDENKLIEYANEQIDIYNNELFEDEKAWEYANNINQAIYALEYDNFSVEKIKNEY